MQKHILVVADAADVVATIPVTLELAGHKVTLADCGLDAILWAERMLPDLIVVDTTLPDMEGTTIVRVLRLLPGTAALATILLEPRCGQFSPQHRFGRSENGVVKSSDLLRQIGFALMLCHVADPTASLTRDRGALDVA
jgi:response regulator RpfG family c-di-GMP phosphodiesterase